MSCYEKIEERDSVIIVIRGNVYNRLSYGIVVWKVYMSCVKTAKEFEILKLLLQNPKKVYTKEQIYSLVWNDAYCGDENAVNVHISRLRNKIEDDSRNPRYVLTVWGIGYKLGESL